MYSMNLIGSEEEEDVRLTLSIISSVATSSVPDTTSHSDMEDVVLALAPAPAAVVVLELCFCLIEQPLHRLAGLVKAEHVLQTKELSGNIEGQSHSPVPQSSGSANLAVPVLLARSSRHRDLFLLLLLLLTFLTDHHLIIFVRIPLHHCSSERSTGLMMMTMMMMMMMGK
ncbi:hypothetical protein RchiOBHm_Chr7g0184611 [Rosa chinensis]|uniref:Uncharacterized protein n=1 Tax=Rosa chinensis TaxID=74649 RepID=A0A2P6P3J0_ROSCH|nr:hypothetical protein RchiOBHm_Chr7g0184611 [Rosa chinensis]